jgi:hypothetical protein
MRDGVVIEFDPRASFFNFTFHKNWKPGFCMLAREIFASERTQEVRCGSLPAVIQSVGPRPCG